MITLEYFFSLLSTFNLPILSESYYFDNFLSNSTHDFTSFTGPQTLETFTRAIVRFSWICFGFYLFNYLLLTMKVYWMVRNNKY
jgi:hypothetical protein